MRAVLGPLRRDKGTAILPFQYRRLRSASRVLVEACPASTLRLLGLPNQNRKSYSSFILPPSSFSAPRSWYRRTSARSMTRSPAPTSAVPTYRSVP